MTNRPQPTGRASAADQERLRLDGHLGRLQVAAATHVGKVRTNNEDFAVAETIERAGVTYRLLLIADGMGGGAKGEVASELAAALVARHLKEEPWAGPHEALAEAFKEANAVVYDRGTGGGEAPRSLMGTTLVAVLVDDTSGRTWLAHAGDSRAYLLPAAGGIQRLTRDHSLVEERVREGQITEREVELSEERNVVTRAIGPYAEVEAELTGPITLNPGDTMLLSTDGLHGMVSDRRIARTAARAKTVQALPEQLIGAGLAGGGKDNVTVVVAAWGGFVPGRGSALNKGIFRLGPIAAATCAAGIVVAVAASVVLLRGDDDETADGEAAPTASVSSEPEPTPATPAGTATQVAATPKRVLHPLKSGEDCDSLPRVVLGLPLRGDLTSEQTRRLAEGVSAFKKLNGLTEATCKELVPPRDVCLPAAAEMSNWEKLGVVTPDECEASEPMPADKPVTPAPGGGP